MFASVRFLVYALFLEFGSLYLMLSGSDSRWGLLTYLALHTLASLAMARGVWGLLPRHYQEPVGATQLLLFSLALFVPLVGLVAMLIGVGIGYALPAVSREEPFVMVRVPSFTPVPAPSGAGFRQEDLRTLLTSPETSTEMRLQGMLTVRDMPTRFTGSVLREVLGDAVDDVRLLAYGILDQKEKQLTQQIDRAMRLLQTANPARAYRLHRRLAELYWELAYQDLVQGDIRELSLRQSFQYVDRALSEKPDDAGMWLLRGRILMVDGDLEEADKSFRFCVLLGLPASRVNPWLAELALWRGQYKQVRELMSDIADDSKFTSLDKAARYWRPA
ncbi:MAG: hypothetical protein KFB92_04760 [Alcanivorax sp.]|jgi:tetratricopeptide (TPR) repeat protein|nr:MAG: hypothetical protein KFB92_04760 [Alcanivorax sp.]